MKKYLGLDLGSVTCGVSWSDTGFIAGTVKTIRFQPDDYDSALDQVLTLCREMHPDQIVLGLPLLENGDAAERAQICMEFGKQLEQEAGIPVFLQDERNTTQESEAIMLDLDISRKHRKKKIDQLAAVAILQRYLDTQVK
ncbi:MAG: Holliday junction resolvase RuvX [Solobacterium sp.]|jgi:putative Holliday junction resolvase|nr:Holliday junction resolvase RuvX [Solobacterium sp.]MCH4204998.1 Holliday junction resolvase RuvX [Solobacterium sp.]MCH4226507.1 Holliday junction resolvase RuvX [Solobacterium sp.]MCH4281791.1 Holliday junction resolvase RuvX [Solobacterium sp.]